MMLLNAEFTKLLCPSQHNFFFLNNISGLITISLMTALPLAIGAFPQRAEVNPLALERRFWDIRDENGRVINKLYYNKGL